MFTMPNKHITLHLENIWTVVHLCTLHYQWGPMRYYITHYIRKTATLAVWVLHWAASPLILWLP